MEISHRFLAIGLMSSYCLCGCIFEHLGVFAGWRLFSGSQLIALQRLTGLRALYIYVVPKTILTVQTVALSLNPPPELASKTISLNFSNAMLAISWISSFMWQVPLQRKIQRTGDTEALNRLYSSTWVRTISMVLHCANVFLLMFGCF